MDERRMQRLYSEAEAAALLGMSPRMLADRRRDGRIECLKDGRFVAFTAEHIAEYCRKTDSGACRKSKPRGSRKKGGAARQPRSLDNSPEAIRERLWLFNLSPKASVKRHDEEAVGEGTVGGPASR